MEFLKVIMLNQIITVILKLNGYICKFVTYHVWHENK